MAQNALLERHIVAYGDYAMKAGGEPLFVCPTGKKRPGEKLFYNGSPGQLVAYTYDSSSSTIPTTVASGDLATLTTDLYIGVFVDQDGDGVADDVRLLAGEKIEKCNIDEASVGVPKCGQPAIEAATLDCVECGETYTVRVRFENNHTRSWSPLFKGYNDFIASYSPDCNTCDDCPPDANCAEIVCGLVKELNNELDLKINDVSYPDWNGYGLPRPYKAVRGHDNWFMYCLGPDAAASDCETCETIDAITDATVGGVPVNFTGNLDPQDATKTLLPQVQNIAFQIEKAFDDILGPSSGFAVVTQGVTPCCPMQLHVVTCDADFAITGLSPCDTASSLSFPAKRICSDCSSVFATGTLTLTGLPLNTETVTIGTKTYTFQDTLTNVDGNVHIGADETESLANLAAAINLDAGAGTAYATSMTVNADVTATEGPGDTLVLKAKVVGASENTVATTETLTNGSFGAATLEGGADGTVEADYVPTCWLAVIAQPEKPDCDCYLEDVPWTWNGVKISVEFLKDANDFKPKTKTATLLEGQSPKNFGSQIQWLEYKYGFPGGRGRRWRASNYRRGSFGAHDDTSRIKNAVTAKCDAMYCSYYMKYKHLYDNPLGSSVVFSPYYGGVHINTTDSTTLADWETFFNALVTANNNNCKVIGSVACFDGEVDLGGTPDIA